MQFINFTKVAYLDIGDFNTSRIYTNLKKNLIIAIVISYFYTVSIFPTY